MWETKIKMEKKSFSSLKLQVFHQQKIVRILPLKFSFIQAFLVCLIRVQELPDLVWKNLSVSFSKKNRKIYFKKIPKILLKMSFLFGIYSSHKRSHWKRKFSKNLSNSKCDKLFHLKTPKLWVRNRKKTCRFLWAE